MPNRWATAPAVGGFFFPQRPLLKIDGHAYSPSILRKIVEAGTQLKSFELAAHMLQLLGEITISGRHVGRLTEMIGQELAAARDERTEDWIHQRLEVAVEQLPEAVAVSVDGGRIMTRTETAGQGPGVFGKHWREDKIACLHQLDGPTFDEDPQPEPPPVFRDSPYVDQMVREIKSHKGLPEDASAVPDVPPSSDQSSIPTVAEEPDEKIPWPPKRSFRTCVATMQNSDAFGPMVGAEAHRRGFFQAKRRAFLADGQACNWTIHGKWFKDFEPIADFIHVLAYLYVAATGVSTSLTERWQRYLEWMTACWQGRVADVLTVLREHRERLGPIGEEESPPESDPRVVLATTITYLEHNAARMDYPRYRRQGLPVTSAAVESLIKEFNGRVKGTEKFWNDPGGAESILQTRAAVLGDDDGLGRHLDRRPGHPFRRRPPARAEPAQIRQAA